MVGKVGLHDDLAGQSRAAGASCDLQHERRQAFRGAEVGAVERVVGAEDADQREPRKIVALGEHLRAHEDVDLLRFDLVAHDGECVLRARRVAVDACDARLRKSLDERTLEPLRAEPQRHQVDVAA